MSVAYFDCFAGAGGDMIVAALIDAGCDFDALAEGLAKLGVAGLAVRTERVTRCGLAGTKFHVGAPGDQPHRHLSDILAMIDAARYAPRVADRATRIFTRLGQAEAKVHGVGLKEVHFHEVGAADSIADIVGACLAMEMLGIDRFVCSPIPAGSGTVVCDHGTFPVPAPATAELLVGAAIAETPIAGEATTPTAAAILTTLAETYGPTPAMALSAVGWGAGTRDTADIPNLLRVCIGEPFPDGVADSLLELSANIDDASGELIGATIERLLAAGCADAWATPAVMKKSRPAWVLSALVHPADVAEAEGIIFRETTTFGIRRRPVQRAKLLREFATVETPYGPIRMKLGRLGDEIVTAAPEFADCRAAADSHHVAVREVMAAASMAYREGR